MKSKFTQNWTAKTFFNNSKTPHYSTKFHNYSIEFIKTRQIFTLLDINISVLGLWAQNPNILSNILGHTLMNNHSGTKTKFLPPPPRIMRGDLKILPFIILGEESYFL